MNRKLPLALVALALLAVAGGGATAQDKKPAAPAGNCKSYGGPCCDPSVTQHLSKEAIFGACGKSDAQYLGEKGSKGVCKYYFKVEGDKEKEAYVEVDVNEVKGQAPSVPPDPFASYKKAVGKVMIAEPKSLKGVKSDKIKAMAEQGAGNFGLYLPANGFFVLVSGPAKICTQTDAKRLAASLR